MKSINLRSIVKGILQVFTLATLLLCFPLFSHGIDVPTLSTQISDWKVVVPPNVSSDWWLNDVHFTSPDEGWAVGSDMDGFGVLLHYSNGTWTNIPSPILSSYWYLYDVYFTSSNDGWAVGYDGTNHKGVLLHYLNGSWTTTVNLPDIGTSCGFYGVHFPSSVQGWVVGACDGIGMAIHYVDGSWSAIDLSELISDWWWLNDVYFTSPNEGWAVGGTDVGPYGIGGGIRRGVLLHCLNGSWTMISPPNAGSYWGINRVHFISSNEGWAVGDTYYNGGKVGVLFHYLDGLWTAIRPPNVSSDWGLSDVHLTSSNEGWGVGWDDENLRGIIIHYQNGSWTNINLPDVSMNWELKGVHFVSPYEGWAVGRDWVNNRGVLLKYSVPIPAITLQSPSDNAPFGACSLYSPPTFSCTAGETFKGYEIQFSSDNSFSLTPVKVKTTTSEATITSSTWKRVLSIPGGTVYWRVVGTRANRTKFISESRSIIIEPPQAVGNLNISFTSKGSLPELLWDNNCNTKFKVWFGSDEQFTKKKTFAFNITNPNDNEGEFMKVLTFGQWMAIRKLVGDVSGSTIYWYVESWDGLKRYNKTDVINFVLTD